MSIDNVAKFVLLYGKSAYEISSDVSEHLYSHICFMYARASLRISFIPAPQIQARKQGFDAVAVIICPKHFFKIDGE